MAIHAGVVQRREGDWFGPVVNRTAGLMRIGHGGQLLLSGAAHELVSDELLPGVVRRPGSAPVAGSDWF
jgi:class 3 adenylate cyclase